MLSAHAVGAVGIPLAAETMPPPNLNNNSLLTEENPPLPQKVDQYMEWILNLLYGALLCWCPEANIGDREGLLHVCHLLKEKPGLQNFSS